MREAPRQGAAAKLRLKFKNIGRRTTAWARIHPKKCTHRRVRLPLLPRRWNSAQQKQRQAPESLGRA
jgi:hypothetical protein